MHSLPSPFTRIIVHSRDADSASCRVAELCSKELPQLLPFVYLFFPSVFHHSFLLFSITQFSIFSSFLSLFLSFCLSCLNSIPVFFLSLISSHLFSYFSSLIASPFHSCRTLDLACRVALLLCYQESASLLQP